MLPTLAAAALLGAIAPFLQSFAWGVPFSLMSIATVLRSTVVSALTVLVIGAAAFFALRATPMAPEGVSRVAAAVGGFLGFTLLLSSVRRMRHVRGLSVLCQRLQEEDARKTALKSLRRLLDRARRSDPRRHIALVLMATGPLTQAGLWGEARDGLRDLDDALLTEPQSVLRNQALATCELQFDATDAAQRAIDEIARPTEPSIEVWLVAIEALLMAVRGDTERALAHLGAQDADDNPSLKASHRLVHAHIYAARGDEEAALEELTTLEREAGSAGLERVVRPRGPASVLAERLLDESSNQSG
jgi:outer membrane PBP1 activator LpoA protein